MPEADLRAHRVATSAWARLLGGEDARAAREVARAIADASPDVTGNPTLSSGGAGIALLHAYLARVERDAAAARRARTLLDGVIDELAGSDLPPWLFDGFSGVALAADLAAALLGDDQDDCGDIDDALATLLAEPLDPRACDVDLVRGLVGIGAYLLGRPRASAAVARIVELLDGWAIAQPPGRTWLRPPELLLPVQRQRFPAGLHDLGVAHGVPGVIVFLAGACRAAPRARPLLEDAVAWLLAQRAGATFATMQAPGIPGTPAGLAWCYGDPGVAAALLCAARAAGRADWEREAVAIGRDAAGASGGVADACLCHGSAGLAHLFNRLFQATGVEPFGAAARAWIARTLAFRRPGAGVAGYRSWQIDGAGRFGWADEPGVVVGAAGVALALLAASSDVEPGWDRILLLSLPL